MSKHFHRIWSSIPGSKTAFASQRSVQHMRRPDMPPVSYHAPSQRQGWAPCLRVPARAHVRWRRKPSSALASTPNPDLQLHVRTQIAFTSSWHLKWHPASSSPAKQQTVPGKQRGFSSLKSHGDKSNAGQSAKGTPSTPDETVSSMRKVMQYLPEAARPLPEQLGVLVTTWRGRALSFARESTLLIYSALIDNTLVVVLERLQLDKLLKKAQPLLESGSARLFGSYHELPSGERVPISLVNNTGPDFSIPSSYTASEVPLRRPKGSGYDPITAHFLSLCMKLVYEEPHVIQDITDRLWGLKFHGYFSTQTPAASLYDVENKNTADFIPRTRASMISSEQGLVIAFRGSEPLNLINLRSSGKITMRPRFGIGRVHDGFYAALFHSDVEAGSLYVQIIECLKQIPDGTKLPIFLSGHSLGGALAQVFAAALITNHPELAEQVRGIYTYGMPRVGDAAFSRFMGEKYPSLAFRITHAADIIPLVPPQFLEYSHFGEEHYITSLGRLVTGREGISKARTVETFGFLPLYLWKLVAGLALNPKEGSLRTIYRLVMLILFPGLNDHFPADYEYKLERLLVH